MACVPKVHPKKMIHAKLKPLNDRLDNLINQFSAKQHETASAPPKKESTLSPMEQLGLPKMTHAQVVEMNRHLDQVEEKMGNGKGPGEAPPRYETGEKPTGVFPNVAYGEDASFVEESPHSESGAGGAGDAAKYCDEETTKWDEETKKCVPKKTLLDA